MDKYLQLAIDNYGLLVYALLFLVIFVETGIVFMAFLPGDSLIFAAGAFAAAGSFDLFALFVLFFAAAAIGDTINYLVGLKLGGKLTGNRFIKKSYIDRTHAFFTRHGGKTIVLARFVPVIRTFAPFVAGVAKMRYSTFMVYNLSGGFAWITVFLLAGYFFGNIPFVKNNFSLVLIALIVISIVPGVAQWLNGRIKAGKK